MSDITNLEPIFRLINLGWKVYPCSRPDHGGKSPWCQHGFRDATDTIAQVIAWSREKPGCNWGLWPCDGLLVLDADRKHGGLEALAMLEKKHGKLPETPTVQTGGGGRHYYFACPKDYQAKAKIGGCEGLELIAGKGGVIVPPSVHAETGKPYLWLSAPWDIPLAQAPAWLLALVEPSAEIKLNLDTLVWGGSAKDFASLGLVPDGERNAVLPGVIGSMLGRGMSEDEVLEQGLAWAEAQEPPYDADELRRKVKSIARKEEAKQQTLLPLSEKVSISISEDRSDSLSVGREGTNSALPSTPELFPSPSLLPVFVSNGQAELVCSLPPSPAWPRLSEEAYQGLIGAIVKTVSPETEADETGVLLCLLCCFGNAVGRTAHVKIGARQHYA